MWWGLLVANVLSKVSRKDEQYRKITAAERAQPEPCQPAAASRPCFSTEPRMQSDVRNIVTLRAVLASGE